MGVYEQHPHIFSVKELLRSTENIFENRSTEEVKDKLSPDNRKNLMDFKYQLVGCCLVTMKEREVFEIP